MNTFYSLKVNGRLVTGPLSDRASVEQVRAQLPVEQQLIAEVVSVTSDGKELLLG